MDRAAALKNAINVRLWIGCSVFYTIRANSVQIDRHVCLCVAHSLHAIFRFSASNCCYSKRFWQAVVYWDCCCQYFGFQSNIDSKGDDNKLSVHMSISLNKVRAFGAFFKHSA